MQTGLWLAVLHQEGALEALAYCAQFVGEVCQETAQNIQTVKEVAVILVVIWNIEGEMIMAAVWKTNVFKVIHHYFIQ
jgi:hypothetical protein